VAKKSTETLVGVLVLLGIIGLAFLTLKAANLVSFSPTKAYSVRALFDDVGGLKKNAPVRCAGVSVGEVTGITLDQSTDQGLVIFDKAADAGSGSASAMGASLGSAPAVTSAAASEARK